MSHDLELTFDECIAVKQAQALKEFGMPDTVYASSEYLPSVRADKRKADVPEWSDYTDEQGHILANKMDALILAFDADVARQELIRQEFDDLVYLLCDSPLVLKVKSEEQNLLALLATHPSDPSIRVVQGLLDRINADDDKIEEIWSYIWSQRKED